MHVAEKLEALRQLVGREDHVGLLNHVRTQIDKLTAESITNVLNFADLAI